MNTLSFQPKALWDYFSVLNHIPRPTYHEEAIRQYLLDEAKRLDLEAFEDDAHNIKIIKPASPGCETAAGVILQSHVDMVPQKTSDKVHDFTKDPIETHVEGEWLTADRTTLGADNGIGVAAILAVLADQQLHHGPIEALFTATEEVGMHGAKGLQPDWLSGDYLLNLDTEIEAELCIGCAGGVDILAALPISKQTVDPSFSQYRLNIKGLAGGHSGKCIDEQRGNAIKILARIARAIAENSSIQLIRLTGGSLRNAIASQSQMQFASALSTDELQAVITPVFAQIKQELPNIDQEAQCELLPLAETVQQCLSAACQTQLLQLIQAVPHGVMRMSLAMPGLVETSINFAILDSDDIAYHFTFMIRSASDSARDELQHRLRALFALAAIDITERGAYPGWQPQPASKIVELMTQTAHEVFNKAPYIRAVHAGLECGLLGHKYPHWQMISFGPSIEGAHSPDECVHIASVTRFYEWLVKTLSALTQQPKPNRSEIP